MKLQFMIIYAQNGYTFGFVSFHLFEGHALCMHGEWKYRYLHIKCMQIASLCPEDPPRKCACACYSVKPMSKTDIVYYT